MKGFEELDALGLAELVRSKKTTPRELVEASIATIEELEGRINSLASSTFDEALLAADSPDLPDGPFKGVPFMLKDLGPGLNGLPAFEGNLRLKEMERRSRADGIVAARFRDAGLIVVGKSSTPEFGAQPTTQPYSNGPTRNPWDLERSVSGSSGGSGAAVAAGMLPMAHATDGGGSIRQPASWCGLVGLKPSRGRIPRGPLVSRLGTELVVSKTVRDTAAALDVACGATTGDLYRLEAPQRPYIEEVGKDPGHLRIGIMNQVDSPAVQIDREAVAATEAAGTLLESLGHEVEMAGPEGLFSDEYLEISEVDYTAMMWFNAHAIWRSIGRDLKEEDFEPYTWSRMSLGRNTTSLEHVRAMSWLQRYTLKISEWWNGFDLLLTPATGTPPAKLEDLIPPKDDPYAIDHPTFSNIRCFVRPFNTTGHPGISLPLHWTDDGLPLGVQLVADMGREDHLIRIAAQLEQAEPWIARAPAL